MNAARPFILVNMAMTADGKIATANRAVTTFGSPRDLGHLYELRATADAVMAGVRTLEETNAKLGPGGARYQRLRLRRGLAEFNLRIIATGSASIDPDAAIFRQRSSPIILLTTYRASSSKLRRLKTLVDDLVVCGEREIDFLKAMRHLRQQWNVRRLLCEGGGELNDALFRAGLVDELHLTICPKIFGGVRAPTLADGLGVARLADVARLKQVSCRRAGDELFLVFRVRPVGGRSGKALAKRNSAYCQR